MKIKIDKISRKEKQGSKGPYTSVGIFVNGQWYNGFGSKENAVWQGGMEVEVELITTPEGYKNFKMPAKANGLDELRLRIERLEMIVYKTEPSENTKKAIAALGKPQDDRSPPFEEEPRYPVDPGRPWS